MKRSELINAMVESVKDYYAANAETGARIDDALANILTQLEEAGLIEEEWDSEEES